MDIEMLNTNMHTVSYILKSPYIKVPTLKSPYIKVPTLKSPYVKVPIWSPVWTINVYLSPRGDLIWGRMWRPLCRANDSHS